MSAPDASQAHRRMPARTHSNFAARTAADSSERLNRRGSFQSAPAPAPNEETPLLSSRAPQTPQTCHGTPESAQAMQTSSQPWIPKTSQAARTMASGPTSTASGSKRAFHHEAVKPRPGAFPRPVGGTQKLGTFAGVFVPTTLNVLSILMFLRFGFILGQTGVVGMMGMLVACYGINLLTTMSISAIATNGTVRGGGAYYMISRSLGPEFGGAIGIVFYLGLVFNTSLNAVGLIDCFIENFGEDTGGWSQWLPQGFWWQFLWATIVLVICTAICLAGSGLFARCSNGLLVLLLIATISIPISTLAVSPFSNPKEHIVYTGLSAKTFRENLMPNFTKGAAGAQHRHKETFQSMFGILFPATGGIFAGASMSGDLKHPSKAIPKGTLSGLGLTFFLYTIVILAMAASITRESLYSNTNVIQLTNISGVVILLGEFATSAFSVLMGVIGSAKLLQALARDHLLPGLSAFGHGTKKSDDPIYAIFLTYFLAQLTMLSDINEIASFITMTYLMTFLVTNLACFLLKIGSAPNFRPSFHFFNWQTAASGAVLSGLAMYLVDSMYASACVVLLMTIFLLIHYTTPPKPWGDVSQSLIYHQVRKYLLRLRQEHVKFWRPQILLLVNDPRRQYKLIQFCNSLKKGALFVLGHVIVSQDFGAAVPEARQQQQSWTKYIDFSKIKAFVTISIAPAVEWGARNIILGAGLGGMRPNIVVMGFYNLGELRQSKPLIDIPSPQPSRPSSRAANHPLSRKSIQAIATKRKATEKLVGSLPTDAMRPEHAVGIQSYVTIVEDMVLRLQVNVALAKGFHELEVPAPRPTKKQRFLSAFGLSDYEEEESSKKYIDVWPIQMSAEIASNSDDPSKKNVLTTNFDTYTLILQLGCILHTVPSWKRTYKLRVMVFVEYETDVEEERVRVTTLLRNLRIEAKAMVLCLATGTLKMYEVIINGRHDGEFAQAAEDVDSALEDEEWWCDIQKLRHPQPMSSSQELASTHDFLEAVNNWPGASFQHSRKEESIPKRFQQLRKMLKRSRRVSLSNLQEAGATVGIRSHRLGADLLSSSSSSSSSDEDDQDNNNDEAIATESKVASSDLSEYDLDASESDSEPAPLIRSRTVSATASSIVKRFSLRQTLWPPSPQKQPQSERSTSDSVTPLKPHPGTTASDSIIPTTAKGKAASRNSSSNSPSATQKIRPPPIKRHRSLPKFTSKPTPRTVVPPEETPGPSIMFVESPTATTKADPLTSTSPLRPPEEPSCSTPLSSPPPETSNHGIHPSAAPLASGYPSHASIPLTFNDLPCRAQHLILNELIRTHSDDTAVVFTTLPPPMAGTSKSEAESVKYVSDLEVLCLGLPPVLLVHSNSMTVTMNL